MSKFSALTQCKRWAVALIFSSCSALAVQAQQAPPPATGGPASQNIFDTPNQTQVQSQKDQPGNNAPIWRDISNEKPGYTSLPGAEMGILVQRGGDQWRKLRNGPITQYGGWGLVGVILAIAAFFAYRGQIKLHGANSGKVIERFTLFERIAHWTMAISFVLLAFSGLTLLFGKHILLPVFGYTLFSWLAMLCKTVHNFVGPLFSISIVVAFIVFVRDNFPRASDIKWLLKGGGLFSGAHVPSHRFNAGEKVWFWGGLFTLGIIVSVSGFILDFPNFGQLRGEMQLAWTWHVIAALIFVAGFFGHAYIGTVGTQDALKAMRTGYVDETWAKEHHEDWYNDVKAGKIPAHRSPVTPAADLSDPART
jgi:formate dehydrogenase subunit gamma